MTINLSHSRELILKVLILTLPFGGFSVTPLPYTNLSFVLIYIYFVISCASIRSSFSPRLFKRYSVWLLAMWIIMFLVTRHYPDPYATSDASLLRQIIFLTLFFTFAINDVREIARRGERLERYFIISVFLLILAFYGGFSRVIEQSGRASLQGVNPNLFAMYCAGGFLVLIDSLMSRRSVAIIRLPPMLTLFGLAVLATAIGLSGSRGALVILAAGLLVYFLSESRMTEKRLLLYFIMALFCMFLLFGIASNSVMLERLLEMGDDARLDFIWPLAFDIVKTNPLFGVGFARTEVEVIATLGFFISLHNEYLKIATASGLAGLGLFLFFFLRLLSNALAWRRRYNSGLQLALWFVVALFLAKGGGALQNLFIWLMFMILTIHPTDFQPSRNGQVKFARRLKHA